MKRHLYMESRFMADSAYIIEYVDLIQKAINQNKKVTFKYFDYAPNKEWVLRYNGQKYLEIQLFRKLSVISYTPFA